MSTDKTETFLGKIYVAKQDYEEFLDFDQNLNQLVMVWRDGMD